MKRLFAIFIALMLINGVAFSQKRELGKVKTVVIDAGHGGDKPGAIGKRCKEKDVNLQVALKFGKLIADNYPEVKIVYTRTTDVDVTLAERAHIANRNAADLFVSIHANSHKTPVPSGVETFVMGLSQSKANMEVAKAENADILLEANYKDNSDYQGFDPNSPESYVMFAMYQNAYLNKSLNFAQSIQNQYKKNFKSIDRGVKQAELFVLYKTTMPAVLTEIGFISNPDEEAFMMSDEGQAKIAISLFNAFAAYKADVENEKVLANPVIDLPGYGKNKVTKAAEPVADTTLADSAALAAQTVAEEAAPTVETAATEVVEEEVQPSQQEERDRVMYRVQFYTSDQELQEGAKELKGVTGFRFYMRNGKYCYTLGNEPSASRAVAIQKELQGKGFKDAWVIPFYKEKRISMQEARELNEE